MSIRLGSALLLSIILLSLSCSAQAQHAPLIERMADGSQADAANPPVATTVATTAATTAYPGATSQTRERPAKSQIGDTTRALLRLQAEGSQAGAALPLLGETASRSYQRYLGSFDHPIPEFFEATLPSESQGGSNR